MADVSVNLVAPALHFPALGVSMVMDFFDAFSYAQRHPSAWFAQQAHIQRL
jgi:hypothetical protein